MTITSLENKMIKDACKLHQRKYRTQLQRCLIEGEHVVQEAIVHGIVELIFLTDKYSVSHRVVYHGKDVVTTLPESTRYFMITEGIARKLSRVSSSSDLFAVIVTTQGRVLQKGNTVILDGLQDPGNIGTILRSAKAFGFQNIMLTEDCVDMYNDKLIRATQGIMFSLNVIQSSHSVLQKLVLEHSIMVYALDIVGADVMQLQTNAKTSYALLLGNEGNGIRANLWEGLTYQNLSIPMEQGVDSLNVAIAASIAMYIGRS